MSLHIRQYGTTWASFSRAQGLGLEDRKPSRASGNRYFTTGAQEKGQEQSAEAPCILRAERFPKLVSLHIHSPGLNLMEAIAHKSSFPLLQELHIHVRGPHWLSIIRYCAGSLVTLAIEYIGNLENTASREDIDEPVIMPRLRNLHYVIKWVEMVPNPFDVIPLPTLRTPSLQAYHEINAFFDITTPMHPDVSSITSLFLHKPFSVSWPAFPRLTHLQLCDDPKEFGNSISGLEGNVSVCPDLAVVEYIPLSSPKPQYEKHASLVFRKRGELTGKLIDFRYLPFEYGPRRLGYSAVSILFWAFSLLKSFSVTPFVNVISRRKMVNQTVIQRRRSTSGEKRLKRLKMEVTATMKMTPQTTDNGDPVDVPSWCSGDFPREISI
jgi:hypothetical protein